MRRLRSDFGPEADTTAGRHELLLDGQPGDVEVERHEALLDADSFDDLPGKWHSAIFRAEHNRPYLRVISSG